MRNSCLQIKLAGTSNEDKLNWTAFPVFCIFFMAPNERKEKFAEDQGRR